MKIMNLEIMDQITLENNKTYVVANNMDYNDKEYYLLIDVMNDMNIMIAYLDGNELVSIENGEKIIELISFFNPDKALDIINKELLSDV